MEEALVVCGDTWEIYKTLTSARNWAAEVREMLLDQMESEDVWRGL